MLKTEIDDLTMSEKEKSDNITYYTNILDEYNRISINNNNSTIENKELKELEYLDRRDVNVIVMNMSK
jgi:hypothetical protein